MEELTHLHCIYVMFSSFPLSLTDRVSFMNSCSGFSENEVEAGGWFLVWGRK